MKNKAIIIIFSIAAALVLLSICFLLPGQFDEGIFQNFLLISTF